MNCFYIIAALFMALSGFFVAKMPVRPELASVSAVFVVLFAVPSFRAVLQWLGTRRGVILLCALGAFAMAIESCAVATGVPYGRFVYTDKIGAKVFDLVPWTVPSAWTPLVLAAMTLARRHTAQPLALCVLGALFLVTFDLVLDPGAVAQKFWVWQHPGAFYDVPLSNFIGWFISGIVGALIFLWLSPIVKESPPRAMLGSAFLILCFWSSVCAWMSLWIPALIGVALLGLLARVMFAKDE